MSAMQVNHNCFGTQTEPFRVAAGWTTDHPSVCTIDFDRLTSGVGEGNGKITGLWEVFEFTFIGVEASPPCQETSFFISSQAAGEVVGPRLTSAGEAGPNGTMMVTRGDSVTLTLDNLGSNSPVSDWKFTQEGTETVVNRTSNLSSRTWTGVVVTSGTVSVKVVQGGQTFTRSKTITVKPRGGFDFDAAAAQKVTNGFNSVLTLQVPPKEGRDLRRSLLDQQFSFNSNSVGDGEPNQGFEYVITISNQSPTSQPTAYRFVINPNLKSAQSEFFQAQCGNFDPNTDPNGFISGLQLRANATWHEGGANANSHWDNYRNAQDDPANNLGVVGEAQVGPPSKTPTMFMNEVTALFNQKKQVIHDAGGVEPCGDTAQKDGSKNCALNGFINWSLRTSGLHPASKGGLDEEDVVVRSSGVSHCVFRSSASERKLSRPDEAPPSPGGKLPRLGGRRRCRYDGPQPPKYVPFKLTLLSLDKAKYAVGERLVFEVLIENVTDEPLFIPWSLDWKSVERDSLQPPPGYLNAVLHLAVEDPKGEAHDTDIKADIYGSGLVPGSLKELNPGEAARIRSPGLVQNQTSGFRTVPGTGQFLKYGVETRPVRFGTGDGRVQSHGYLQRQRLRGLRSVGRAG